MGLFDRLRRRARAKTEPVTAAPPSPDAAAPEAPAEDLDAAIKSPDKPLARRWHYEFAHVGLRIGAFEHAAQVVRYLANPGTSAFVVAEVMARVAEQLHLPREELLGYAREIKVSVQRLGDLTLVIVAMPPPADDSEAHFVGIAVDEPTAPTHIEYYTLEQARGGETMICGWNRDGEHLNFGPGPSPSRANFAAAIAARR